ncbi:MAG: ABC transporter permease [Parachlamydiales bacterium]|jgi:putative ABC transport system permease protein
MNIWNSLSKSFRTLMMRRLRTLLSTLGVLFGVVAVIAMLSIGEGAKQETLEQIEQLGMNSIIVRQIDLTDEQQQKAHEKRSQGLSPKDGIAIAQAYKEIKHVAPVKVIEGMITGASTEVVPELLAVTGSFAEIKGLIPQEGRNLCNLDVDRKQQVCVLGHSIAQALGLQGHVGQTIRIENTQFKVVGILAPKQWSQGKSNTLSSRNLNTCVLIPLGCESSLPARPTSLPKNTLNELIVQLSHSDHIIKGSRVTRRVLEQTHYGVEDYQMVIPLELMQQAHRTQQTFNLVLGSIAAISLLVGGIGIMNIMLATVSERTREIGIRRAVGANKRHILVQFLLETLLLTLTGALLGIVIGIFFSWGISAIAGWQTIVKPWSILLSLGMASGVGIFSGLYPAIKASSMNPITALRHE